MPEQLEQRQDAEDDAPPLDPGAVEAAYRVHRARRRARVEHRRRVKRAGVRFWVVLVALLAAVAVIGATLSRQIEQLFGL